jgi:nitrogen fixation protein NifB
LFFRDRRRSRRAGCHQEAERMTVRIAFAGDSESRALDHFGHAQEFVVFDVGEDAAALVEARKNDPFCSAGPKGEDALSATTGLLHDCQVVISAAAGPCVQQALAEAGLAALEYQGTIDEALAQLVARGFSKKFAGKVRHS